MFSKKEPVVFKKWHAFVLGLIVIIFLFLRFWPSADKLAQVKLGQQQLVVILADTIGKQYKGLSDRDSIKPYDGMLFVFDSEAPRTFVMRRMRFPIDMFWIAGNTVVDIVPNVPLEPNRSELELTPYTGRLPADKVLELPAGFADKYGVKVGDKISVILQ